MIEKYTSKQVLDFLRSISVMNLAVADNNKPMASVLLFHVDEDFNFSFATHEDSYKAQAVRKNPRVSFSVWEHQTMLVQVDGVAEEITEPTTLNQTLDGIAAATNNIQNFWPPVLRIRGEDYAVFTIKATWMRVLDLSSNTITAKELPFVTIVGN